MDDRYQEKDAILPAALEVLLKPQRLEKSTAGFSGQALLGSSMVVSVYNYCFPERGEV